MNPVLFVQVLAAGLLLAHGGANLALALQQDTPLGRFAHLLFGLGCVFLAGVILTMAIVEVTG